MVRAAVVPLVRPSCISQWWAVEEGAFPGLVSRFGE